MTVMDVHDDLQGCAFRGTFMSDFQNMFWCINPCSGVLVGLLTLILVKGGLEIVGIYTSEPIRHQS